MNKQVLLYILILLFCGSCSTSNIAPTEYIPGPSATVYEETTPCDIRMLVQLPDDGSEYIHIGTCVTKQSAGGGSRDTPKNYAAEEIQKCACKHGGDIVKIVDFNQTTGQDIMQGGLKKDPNDSVSKLVYHDSIRGEVYVRVK